jgi:hypothetical protein
MVVQLQGSGGSGGKGEGGTTPAPCPLPPASCRALTHHDAGKEVQGAASALGHLPDVQEARRLGADHQEELGEDAGLRQACEGAGRWSRACRGRHRGAQAQAQGRAGAGTGALELVWGRPWGAAAPPWCWGWAGSWWRSGELSPLGAALPLVTICAAGGGGGWRWASSRGAGGAPGADCGSSARGGAGRRPCCCCWRAISAAAVRAAASGSRRPSASGVGVPLGGGAGRWALQRAWTQRRAGSLYLTV